MIRLATPDDAAALTRLLEAFNGPTLAEAQTRRRLLAIEGVETVFLAVVEGEAAGCASLRVVPFLSDDVPRAELAELYVDPPYRRRGIGGALVRYAEALAIERGATELILLTGLNNHDAQAFYRRLGYREAALAMERSLR
jgi:ribosomal protein S18 acetylase RimI-like enzyme